VNMLVVQHWWGGLWTVEEDDWTGILARLIVSVFLAAIIVVLIVGIIAPVSLFHWFSGRREAHAYASTLPNSEAEPTLESCPGCGSTASLDITPCVKCGYDLIPRRRHR
jgi:hypothetical protein